MRESSISEKFRKQVETKFQIYNSLFMSLPYDKMTNIGMLLPFLYEESREGYLEGKNPEQIMDAFFLKHTSLKATEEKMDLLFKIVQYIERQVVLFDSIEDAAFPLLHSTGDSGTLDSLHERSKNLHKEMEVQEKLNDFGVRVVFTAHPTQFYPGSVQRILHDLRSAIQRDALNEIDMLLQQLGKTPFVNKQRPTPLDEALSIIYYLRYVYYDSLGELYTKIKDLFGHRTLGTHSQLLELGFWPGGDRDGNPYVTAEVTLGVARELRLTVLKCYHSHLKKIRRRLSFRGVDQILEELSGRIYSVIMNPDLILTSSEILQEIERAQSILEKDHNGLFMDLLLDFKGRVKIFGTHFASLDLRQDARIHTAVLDELLSNGSDQKTRANFSALDPNIYEGIVKDTLESIAAVETIQKKNGAKGLQRYIISNSQSTEDVLNVVKLFELMGYPSDNLPVDIVPLFETMEGLEEADVVMKMLYEDPKYQAHLSARGKVQTIMLGFSDGTKDGGYLKANWEIFTTKERLTKVSKEYGIQVVFFDGRGGPPARGGGKTHDFYAAQGKGISSHKIELTIQGQTITSVFGNKDQASYNFEQLISAGIENQVFSSERSELLQEDRALLEELAVLSFEHYSELKNHPKFVAYLEEISPLKYYGRANIASRPSKRSAEGPLRFEDLRAIPFVGSWSQLKQNVPGYYGVGHALETLKKNGRMEEVKALFQKSDFFRTLILNSMMSMNKSYFPLTQYMKNDEKFGEFWSLLEKEFQLSKQMTLELTGFEELQEEDLLSKKSVQIRERIVLPLLTIQQYALMQIPKDTTLKSRFEKLVIRSLFGNINASRNSA